jgi:hypothetical protein
MSTQLIAQLRESLPYLADEGWTNTAKLMGTAANELERLTFKIQELEQKLDARKQGKIKISKRSDIPIPSADFRFRG